ncbi:ABC transporter substrate-binding protein [Streptomyces sp. NPDC002577]
MTARHAMRWAAAAASGALVTSLVTGCGYATTTVGAEAATLKVGVITVNSGSFAGISKQSLDAATVTAQELNAAQHTYKVDIVRIDTDGTPINTLQAVQKAVRSNDVRYVSGFISTSTGQALSAQAKRLGILVLAPVAQSATLVGPNCNANYFQFGTVDSQYTLGAEEVLKKAKLSSWDTITPDYSAGHDKAAIFERAVNRTGGTVRTSVFPAQGATDFGPQISKLGRKKSKGLFVGILGGDAATFTKQAAQFGLFDKYRFIMGSGYLQASELPAMGNAVIGAHEVLNYSPDAVNKTPFAKSYAARNSSGMWHVPIEGNLALTVLAEAADKAGSTAPAKVGKAMSGLSVDTLVGKVTMRAADHLLLQPLYPAHVETGPKLVTDSTIPIEEATPAVSPECKM